MRTEVSPVFMDGRVKPDHDGWGGREVRPPSSFEALLSQGASG